MTQVTPAKQLGNPTETTVFNHHIVAKLTIEFWEMIGFIAKDELVFVTGKNKTPIVDSSGRIITLGVQ